MFYRKQINSLSGKQKGFKPYEHVKSFFLISKPFEVGEELTNLMKLKEILFMKNIKIKSKNCMKLSFCLFFIFFVIQCQVKDNRKEDKKNYTLYSLFSDIISSKDLCYANRSISPISINLKNEEINISRKKSEFSACDPLSYLKVLEEAKLENFNIAFNNYSGGLQGDLGLVEGQIYTKEQVYNNSNAFTDIVGEASVEFTFVFKKNTGNTEKTQIKVHLNSNLDTEQNSIPSFTFYPDKISFQYNNTSNEINFKCWDSNLKEYILDCSIPKESITTVCAEIYPRHQLVLGWLNPCEIVLKNRPDFKLRIEKAKFQNTGGLSFKFRQTILKSFVINERGIYTGTRFKKISK